MSPLSLVSSAGYISHNTDAFIDGHWQTGASRFPVLNPFSGEVIAEVTDSGPDLAEAAIIAANVAFPIWRDTLAKDRAAILLRWADLIETHQNDLARLLTAEQGKPIAEALGEIRGGIESIRWAANAALELRCDIITPFKKDTQIQIRRDPVGVCVAITPWNFPVGMITRKVAPALAAGCTMVLKPAEDTPLCALALADLGSQAGLPKGVFNVLPVSRQNVAEIGKFLCTHAAVRKISFTGSTAVGRILSTHAAPHIKRLSLELGGNAPFIIFASADLDKAIDGLIASKFRNAGQTCICANRVFVEKSIFNDVVERLKIKTSSLQIGDGVVEGTQIGPLINQAALDKVKSFVKGAESQGAKLVIGGSFQGLCYSPTILTGLDPKSALNQTEIFGPVAVLTQFSTEDEAISMANDTEFGLAAYVYSSERGQIERVVSGLEYGMVGVNESILAHASIPFGGRKSSGFGREGGPDCLEPFLDPKYILLGGF